MNRDQDPSDYDKHAAALFGVGLTMLSVGLLFGVVLADRLAESCP